VPPDGELEGTGTYVRGAQPRSRHGLLQRLLAAMQALDVHDVPARISHELSQPVLQAAAEITFGKGWDHGNPKAHHGPLERLWLAPRRIFS
jgi:hypothetical protein